MPEDTLDTTEAAEQQDEAPEAIDASEAPAPAEGHEAGEAGADESDAQPADLSAGDDPAPPAPAGADLLSDEFVAQVVARYDAVAAAAALPPPSGTVIVVHGSYCGPGCPDASKRAGANKGFEYDKAHPALPGETIIGLKEHQVAAMTRGTWMRPAAFKRA